MQQTTIMYLKRIYHKNSVVDSACLTLSPVRLITAIFMPQVVCAYCGSGAEAFSSGESHDAESLTPLPLERVL